VVERQIPGGPYVNETGTLQAQIPGGQYVNETQVGGNPQIIVPTADIAAGAWLGDPNADLYANLDETAASDADFIHVGATGSVCEVSLQAAADPAVSTGHTVRYRAKGDGSTDLIVKLVQGTTVIASWTETNVPATETGYQHTLTGTEADSITNYSDLRLRFEAA
jgi:hypothetical protein